MKKQILMIAGPNGAGKTTTALALMPHFFEHSEFVNADEIARGISPYQPESVAIAASKIMIARIRELLEQQQNFAFETTAAGTNYIKYLKEAKKLGYEISLLFLWLPSPEHAVFRVAQRIKQGGHSVPEETIRRRYFLGIKNTINNYLLLIDNAVILDSTEIGKNAIIAEKNGIRGKLTIFNDEVWNKMKLIAND